QSLEQWKCQQNFGGIFEASIALRRRRDFGDDAVMHHVFLDDGSLYDLFVQSTERDNFERALKILGCRDAGFADRLAGFADLHEVIDVPAEESEIRGLIEDFWLNAHKHAKVLARDLDLLALVG